MRRSGGIDLAGLVASAAVREQLPITRAAGETISRVVVANVEGP